MPERLQRAKKKIIGSRQTLKALQGDKLVEIVYVAEDADERVVKPIRHLCRQKDVHVVAVETMAELGNYCMIDVGAAAAAIIR